jgi:C-terminal processing protease CtpA/Prc
MTATPLEGGRVLYVRSTSLSPYTDAPMMVQIKAYAIMEQVIRSGGAPTDVVVDLRYNGGGNFLNITNFATELVGLIGPSGHVYVITGRATNSAAIVFTALLKGQARGRTTIVGEEASDNLWFWSEGGTLQAPASKLPLHYTDGYHDWAHGCGDRSKCYWPAMFHGVAVGSIRPDKPIEMTYADYVAGRDPALEAALALARAGH